MGVSADVTSCEQDVDLVILDVDVPKLDGPAVAARSTTEDDIFTRTEAMGLGVSEFLANRSISTIF